MGNRDGMGWGMEVCPHLRYSKDSTKALHIYPLYLLDNSKGDEKELETILVDSRNVPRAHNSCMRIYFLSISSGIGGGCFTSINSCSLVG